MIERLIGPASDDIRTSKILDKDTVASIKEAMMIDIRYYLLGIFQSMAFVDKSIYPNEFETYVFIFECSTLFGQSLHR